MVAWPRTSAGVGLLLLLPTTLLMLVLWLCQCGWMRRWLEGGGAEAKKSTQRVRQSVNSEFTIPGEVVGRVIGRHGMHVRQLEEQSGARIKFKDQQDSKDKVVVISGRAECVRAAEEAVKKVVQESVREREEEKEKVTMSVPQFAVGRIIGRQGATIRALQRESGARINMVRGSDGALESVCVVSGSQEQIVRAVSLVKEAVQQSELSRKCQALRGRQQRDGGQDHSLSLTYIQLPETDSYFPAFVSAVDAGGVWLQLVEGEDPAKLESLVEMMTVDYSVVAVQESLEATEGTLCAVPFEHDNSWYRGRVVGVREGQVEVLYVDYGDSGNVQLCTLRSLKPEYCVLPVQAIRCELAGIEPVGDSGVWGEEALQELDLLTLCATWRAVMVRVCSGEGSVPTIQVVDTTTDQDVDVAEQLVTAEHARWTHPSETYKPQGGKLVKFRWEGDAKEVGVAGSFSDWKTIGLEEKGTGIFECDVSLPEGRHEYKLLVDGQWKHDQTQPTVANAFGALNNTIDVEQ